MLVVMEAFHTVYDLELNSDVNEVTVIVVTYVCN